MDKHRRIIFVAGSIATMVVAFIVVIYLFPRTHYLSGIQLKHSDGEIIRTVNEVLQEYSIPSDGMYVSVNYRQDPNLYTYLHREYGTARGNRLMRDGVPAFYTQIRWYSEPPSRLKIFPGTDRTAGTEVTEDREFRILDNSLIHVDMNGMIVHIRLPVADSFILPSVSLSEARTIALDFIDRHTPFSGTDAIIESEVTSEHENRSDHVFNLSTTDDRLPVTVALDITVSGNMISSFRGSYDIPRYADASQYEFITQALYLLILAVLVPIIILVGIRRIRTGEIGYKLGAVFGAIVTVGFLAGLMMAMADDFALIMFISFSVVSFVLGGITFAGWSVGEALSRETWREHFKSLDLLSYGNILHSSVGRSVLGGITAGIVILAIQHGMYLIAGETMTTWYILPQFFFNIYNSFAPSLTNIAFALYNTLHIVALIFLFIPALIVRRTGSVYVPFIIASLVYGSFTGIYLQPMPAGIFIGTVGAFALLLLFHRTDILTLLVGYGTYMIMDWGVIYFFTEQPELLRDGLFLAIPFVGAVICSAAGILSRDKINEAESFEPHYVRYITERERLQREIEIAREVQMSFLPLNTPQIPGLDIAARCIPANEIGGDYYDFVHLDSNRTGIIIGDVSGKGTKAAFYMTLAKGMIHSTINGVESPAEVLNRVNTQFYRQANRSAFISMVYGIFNTREHSLTLSRAGHNPTVYFSRRDSSVEFCHPDGIALGLEHGPVFSNRIKDMKIPYRKGDIFIFYTDGITEAMNRNREEFGNNRLFEIIKTSQEENAATILDGIYATVGDFTRRAEQTDDMTMVVVKVN